MTAQWADFPSGDLGLYDGDESKMLDGIWAEVIRSELVNDPDPAIGSAGRVIRIGQNSQGGGYIRKVLSGSRTTVGMSARIWTSNLPGALDLRPVPFAFRNGANDVLVCVVIETTGALSVRRDNRDGAIIAQTAGPVITANSWVHLSAKVVFGAGTAGSVSIEREGLNILNAEEVNTYAGPCAQVSHDNAGSVASFVTEFFIKDSYIWDGLGTVNNDHPGPVTVYRKTVASDVSSGWSRTSGATDYGLLNETPPNDAGYIYAGYSPIPAPSIMGLEDLPPEVVSIRAVFLVGRQRKSDGGDCKTQMSITPNGGTDWYDGTDRAITTAFTYWYDVSEVSPDTGAPWTPIEFNNAEFKINRTL